ncbi:hypothetical protein SpCBS45565_g06061 [Spizellomyces sp. 'palustris']|nr:hypothetical protein SpCBS45565_g06061 [Spizellomyces sp. 'palustris']
MPSTDIPMQDFHVLILDEVGTPTVNNTVSYTSFLSSADNVSLLIITSKGALSQADKSKCLEYVEISNPTTNGMVELHALKLHEKYRIDRIYTKQEDLILRAAHLRRLLGIATGLAPEDALLFRDKHSMKQAIRDSGFAVPDFARVYSPCDVLSFVKTHDYPVIIKPTLGSASAGVRVVKSPQDLEKYLESEFYDCIDEHGKCMDYSGDMIIEEFVKGKMYHVNGYAKNGALQLIWPFVYLKTNLEFTMGEAYGNVLIPRNDQRWQNLFDATERILKALPTPEDLIFHLELFEVDKAGTHEFVLCEIAARRPGGSIGLLINAAEGGSLAASQNHADSIFPEIEFRLSIGLSLRHNRLDIAKIAQNPGFAVADLMIPRQIGKLVTLPSADAKCPVPNLQYFPIAKPGSVYKGFDINTMNTCARFVAISSETTVEEMEGKLSKAHQWFKEGTVYEQEGSIGQTAQ